MSPELIAILGIGVTVAGGQLASVLWLANFVRAETGTIRAEMGTIRAEMGRQTTSLRSEITSLRSETSGQITALRTDIAELRDRTGKLEGLLEGLRDAISARRDIA